MSSKGSDGKRILQPKMLSPASRNMGVQYTNSVPLKSPHVVAEEVDIEKLRLSQEERSPWYFSAKSQTSDSNQYGTPRHSDIARVDRIWSMLSEAKERFNKSRNSYNSSLLKSHASLLARNLELKRPERPRMSRSPKTLRPILKPSGSPH